MQKIILIFALVFPAVAFAEFVPRCSTDAFGNTACMDKDGVLTTTPAKSARVRQGSAASGVPADDASMNGEETKLPLRCAIDAFGNKVCNQ